MALSINNENKNTDLSITNESKTGSATTWADMTITWAEADGTWDSPGFPLQEESKNNLSISNENKN